ncbi:MAG: cobyric acid synthase [Bacillota bacterium]
MPAKCIMIQGTASNAGKSFIATGLCRLLYQEGFKVAPYKSQNMALNSYVTLSGGEIGRAQGVQAEAAGITATVEMNPILLKPKEGMVAQVIVLGKPLADMSAGEYRDNYVSIGIEVVRETLAKLREEYEILVIEGAGSPAEINLRDRDIANMTVAFLAEAPVILVADIDRGGSFASIIGTLELLTTSERQMVAGFIINKFRGDESILKPGLDYLEERTGLPVLGVIPYIKDPGIEEEDSVALQDKKKQRKSTGVLDIAVIRLPLISNYTDFNPLEIEADVNLRYVESREDLGAPDAVIIPGTKSTTGDLHFLHTSGLVEKIMELSFRGTPVVGVCGGFQMLGEDLHDPEGTESRAFPVTRGLGLLPISTTFVPAKITRQVKARISAHAAWGDCANLELEGYEIRHGQSNAPAGVPCIRTYASAGSAGEIIGVASPELPVMGTYLHNIFHNDLFRRRWLNTLRLRKGLPPLGEDHGRLEMQKHREESYDNLASLLRKHLDLQRLYGIMGIAKI